MVELPCKDLGFVDIEQPTVLAPCSTEEGSDFGNEVGWCANSETVCVDGEAKNMVDRHDSRV